MTKSSSPPSSPPPSPPPTSNKSGTTIQADIRSLLNNDELTDILLIPTANVDHYTTGGDDDSRGESYIGTIGEGIPAIKSILAARSPVFRRMLYGDFREREKNEEDEVLRIKFDYSSSVLRALVEFCFTDRLDSLEDNDSGDQDDNCSSNDSRLTDDGKEKSGDYSPSLSRTARLLTSLSAAANYFDIPKLEHDILARLDEIMTKNPSLSCVVLDEATKIMQEDLCRVAMERIRARPKAALLPYDNNICDGVLNDTVDNMHTKGGVVALSPLLLERVVFDEKSTASELTKFTCLQKWVEGCQHQVAGEEETVLKREIPFDEEEKGDEKSRMSSLLKSIERHTISSAKSHLELKRSIAANLARKLDLSLIPASDLDTVSHSNLLSHDDLFKAYRLQALNAERTKSKVIVEGAGISEINGTYIQGGVHEGIPMYNKEGVWRNREEVYRIFLCTYSNGNKSWCISIVPKGKEPGKTTDVDFYECPVAYGNKGGVGPYSGMSENGLGVVPSRGWKLVNFGEPPTPKCSLIAGVSSD